MWQIFIIKIFCNGKNVENQLSINICFFFRLYFGFSVPFQIYRKISCLTHVRLFQSDFERKKYFNKNNVGRNGIGIENAHRAVERKQIHTHTCTRKTVDRLH